MSSYDIGIVGAGAHGASAAHHLSRRGVSTIVFDRGVPAGGPTGQASGLVRSYYTNQFLAEIASRSTAFLAELAPESGYVETGGLYLHGAGDLADVQAASEGLTAVGIEHEVLGPDELADRCGAALVAATDELAHLLGAADTPRERPADSPGKPKASS